MNNLTPYQYRRAGQTYDLTALCDDIGKESVAVLVAQRARGAALTDALLAMKDAGEMELAKQIISMWNFA